MMPMESNMTGSSIFNIDESKLPSSIGMPIIFTLFGGKI